MNFLVPFLAGEYFNEYDRTVMESRIVLFLMRVVREF